MPNDGRRPSELLDVSSIRADYPLLERVTGRGGERLAYLDSAATSLVPDKVIDAVVAYEHTSCANIHRGAHLLAEESTDIYESTREQVASFLGMTAGQVVFTHGATESLNMVARCWATHNLEAGDTIVVSMDSHHANIVPWQMIAEEYGFELVWIGIGSDGLLDLESWEAALKKTPKLVALTAISNVLGYVQPSLGAIARQAKEAGARVVLDGAQMVGHMPFAIDDGTIDFLAFSAHKMHALTGLGILWCGDGVACRMRPLYGGGGMIERVDTSGFLPAGMPAALEAGTPAIASVVSLQQAMRYIQKVGLPDVAAHTRSLCARAVKGLTAIPEVGLLGNADIARESLVSFTIAGVHPHDVSQELSNRGIAVRAGHHCAMPLHRELGIPASVRASFSLYNTEDEVDRLVDAVRDIVRMGRGIA